MRAQAVRVWRMRVRRVRVGNQTARVVGDDERGEAGRKRRGVAVEGGNGADGCTVRAGAGMREAEGCRCTGAAVDGGTHLPLLADH